MFLLLRMFYTEDLKLILDVETDVFFCQTLTLTGMLTAVFDSLEELIASDSPTPSTL